MPEFNRKGNVELCSDEVLKHLKYIEFVFGPEFDKLVPNGEGRDRLSIACSGMEKVFEKIKAIKALAKKTNNQQLLALLEKEFGYGLLIGW